MTAYERLHALHGLVDQIPRNNLWTEEQKALWMIALNAVLDMSVKIKAVKNGEEGGTPDGKA